jgi:hypothetical protein
MGADGVVDLFPVAQLTVSFFHLQRASRDLVELRGVGTLGAFDRAVELRRARGSTNKRRPRCCQACSNSAANSLPPSTLQGANGKGHAVLQHVEELGGGLGKSPGVSLDHIPARDLVAGRELFENHTRHRAHIESIDLHQVPGVGHRVRLGLRTEWLDAMTGLPGRRQHHLPEYVPLDSVGRANGDGKK